MTLVTPYDNRININIHSEVKSKPTESNIIMVQYQRYPLTDTFFFKLNILAGCIQDCQKDAEIYFNPGNDLFSHADDTIPRESKSPKIVTFISTKRKNCLKRDAWLLLGKELLGHKVCLGPLSMYAISQFYTHHFTLHYAAMISLGVTPTLFDFKNI